MGTGLETLLAGVIAITVDGPVLVLSTLDTETIDDYTIMLG